MDPDQHGIAKSAYVNDGNAELHWSAVDPCPLTKELYVCIPDAHRAGNVPDGKPNVISFNLIYCREVIFFYLRFRLPHHVGKERRTASRRCSLPLSIRLLRIIFNFRVIVYAIVYAIERNSPSDSNRNGNTQLKG